MRTGDAQRVARTLLPDILPFDHAQTASYPNNGRTLTDDDLLVDFPYLGPPHTAFAARPPIVVWCDPSNSRMRC
jgi:hypothetical protein